MDTNGMTQQQRLNAVLGSEQGERGIALLTTVLLLVGLTIMGIAAMTVTSMDNRMAGFGRSYETAASASEACLGTAVKIIQDTQDIDQVPANYLDNASPPGPVPAGNAATLLAEIMGNSDNNPDTADAAPNTVINLQAYQVRGDIDRLYALPKVGGALQFAAGYEGTGGGAAGGGVDVYYRVDCVAVHQATSTRNHITAVYACTVNNEMCVRKI